MRKFTLFVVALSVLSLCSSSLLAQMVGTNVFLQGRYLEIGMNNNGSFGVCAGIPTGYHPHTSGTGLPPVGTNLAEVYDYGHDGWATAAAGAMPYMGDYTYAGSPFEGWEIQTGTSRGQAFQSCAGAISVTTGFVLTGANVAYSNTGGRAKATWQGSAMAGQLAIRQETYVDTNASWVNVQVTLKNTGATTIPSVYYLRSCDPDIDQTWAGGSFATGNVITYQNDSTHRVLVSSTGAMAGTYFGLGARDARARCCVYSAWPVGLTVDLALLWSTWAGAAGTGSSGDIGIGLTFNLGDLLAGDSIKFEYAYIFNGVSGFDSALPPPCTGMPAAGVVSSSMPVACATSPFTLTNTVAGSGFAFQWQSSADSSSWTNIAGATNATHTSSGIAATTYYRCITTCAFSGLSAVSPGCKVLFATCCTGTPTVGTAIASTTYCSSCSLTLNLTSVSTGSGMLLQWQSSIDNITFTDMVGANTAPYTFVPAPGAAFYRCKVTCVPSGSTVYSSVVSVLFPYEIVKDSVTALSDTVCVPKFYVRTNGYSPLLMLKTWYGDGTHDSLAISLAGTIPYVLTPHPYSYPGVHTVKQVLYYNNIPMDSVMKSYNYQKCSIFPLRLYYDANANCTKDGSELYNFVPVSIRVDSNGTPVDTIAVTSGLYYKGIAPTGTIYSFSILPSSPFYALCPSGGVIYDTVLAVAPPYPMKEFALSCSSTPAYDFGIAVSQVKIGTHRFQFDMYMFNNYCTPSSGTLAVSVSPKVAYVGLTTGTTAGTVAPLITGNTLSWSLPALSSLAAPRRLVAYCEKLSSLTSFYYGDTLHSAYAIGAFIGDADTCNNNLIRVDTVKAGFDPNYIAVTPPGCFDNAVQKFKFTVHFENTGNDTAHNVYVLDTLSDNLDESSLNTVFASHQMNYALLDMAGYKVAKFEFPSIKLLDSSQHGLNDGMFQYEVNSKAGLPDGALIRSRVGIYFDYNDVVMTNTVQNNKGCPVSTTGVQEAQRVHPSVYPNPASESLTLRADVDTYSEIIISNSLGQEMIHQQLTTPQTSVSVKMLPPGVYIVSFCGAAGRDMVKFIKE